MPEGIPHLTSLVESFVAGEGDPVASCEAALRHAAESPAGNVFITVTRERALREAAASAERYRAGAPLGPLDGIPVVVKDMLDVAGTRTTMGSATRREAPIEDTDAAVVANLAAAGAVCLGKSVLSEFAFSGLGLNPHFGNVRNPRHSDVSRIAGGSSSGSAVAVSAGIAPIALGTDTSGSVRVPAAFCEIAGFKAGEDRYDMTGVSPLSVTLDSLGVFAHRVADIVATDAAMRDGIAAPLSPVEAGRMRVVVPEGELIDDCAPGIAEAFAGAMRRLADAGVEVTRRRIRALDEAQELMSQRGTLVVAEAHRLHGHLLADDHGGVDPLVLRRLRSYAGISDEVHVVAERRREFRDLISAELGDAILAYPTVRDPAPAMAPLLADLDLAEVTNRRALRSTMVTSYLGMPGMALPTSPGSVLLSVPEGEDDRLLATALTVEALLG